jgi:calcineurin-like phosphoesterase family protein
MTIFVTADQHFSHKTIIQYSSRPFSNIEDHDEALITAWNETVSENDTVYHLGDFTLGNPKKARSLFARLNGNIKVVANPWHHDGYWLEINEHMTIPFIYGFSKSDGIVSIELPIIVLENVIKIEGAKHSLPAIMCHYAFQEWDRSHYGAVHFHGHSHGTLPRIANRLDVGVDSAYLLTGKYRPFELNEAVVFSKKLT